MQHHQDLLWLKKKHVSKSLGSNTKFGDFLGNPDLLIFNNQEFSQDLLGTETVVVRKHKSPPLLENHGLKDQLGTGHHKICPAPTPSAIAPPARSKACQSPSSL